MANEEIRLMNIETALQTAADLFVEHGIQNTTREMLARTSGLSRRSTERYFPTRTDFIVETAVWVGRKLYEECFSSIKMLEGNLYTARQALETYLLELKKILMVEPRLYVCYAEFSVYLYRDCDKREEQYKRFVEAAGCRQVLKRIFEKGREDGTVSGLYNPEEDARCFANFSIPFFANIALLYDAQPELMERYVDMYIKDLLEYYCDKR